MLKNKNIGFVLTGSFYVIRKVIPKIKKIVKLLNMKLVYYERKSLIL